MVELMHETQRPVTHGHVTRQRWVRLQRSKEDRLGNRRLATLATQLRDCMLSAHPDMEREPFKLICWRSATAVIGGRRIATLRRCSAVDGRASWLATQAIVPGTCTSAHHISDEFILDWHPHWWSADVYAYEAAAIRDSVHKALAGW